MLGLVQQTVRRFGERGARLGRRHLRSCGGAHADGDGQDQSVAVDPEVRDLGADAFGGDRERGDAVDDGRNEHELLTAVSGDHLALARDALEGLTDLVNTIKQVHANLNKDLAIIGLLRVMFDPRITLQQQVSDQLKAHFGEKVFNAVIPRNVRLAEAPSYGVPGVVFDPASKGAQAFVSFAQEMVERIERMAPGSTKI